MKPVLLLFAALTAAPVPLWSQCVSSLTYTPAHPVSGQPVTFTFTLGFAPGYTPPPDYNNNEEYFSWDTISGPHTVQDDQDGIVSAPGTIQFSSTPSYAGLFTAMASYRQTYAFGVPPACPNISGESDTGFLVAPSGQTEDSNFYGSALSGRYVFQFQGSTPEALPTNKVVAVGSFTSDGQGHIVSGVEDINSAEASRTAVPILSGTYTIDGATGSVELVTPLGAQHFDIFNSIDRGSGISNATLIYTDATPLGSGTLTKQSPFTPSGAWFVNLQGTAPASAGLRNVFTPAVLVGLIDFNGRSTSAYLDLASSETGVRKGISEQGKVVNSDSNGRFTFTLSSGEGSFQQPTHFVAYTADATHFFTISLDNYQDTYLFSGSGAQ